MQVSPVEMTAASGRRKDDPSTAALVPSFVATRQRFLVLLAIIFGLHVLVRLLTSPVADLDESEQLVFSQAWQWGYGPQPPLYTWLQILVFKICGPSVLGLALLKNALLFAAYGFTYASGRLVTRSHAGGILAALSLLFIPQIAYESQRDLTHSVLAMTVAAATLFLFLKLQQTRARWLHALLGVAMGLGMLSNYNYALLVAGLVLSSLCLKEFRACILTRWSVVSLALALIVLLPHVLWVQGNLSLVLSTAHKLRVQPQSPAWLAVLRATLNLGSAWFSHVISIVLVFSVLCWKELFPLSPEVLGRQAIRFLLLVLASALVCVLVTMWATSATAFKGRWLQPIYFFIPIVLVAVLHERLTHTAGRRIVLAALLVAGTVMVMLPGRLWLASRLGRTIELNALSSELTEQMRTDAAQAGAIATDSFFIAGNLRLILPGKPIVTPQFQPALRVGGAPVLVFNATFSKEPSPELQRWAAAAGIDLAMAEWHYIDPTSRSGDNGRFDIRNFRKSALNFRSDAEKIKGTPPGRVPFVKCGRLLRAQDGVLGSLRHAELHDTLGRDLDLFASGRVASDARLAVHEHQLAQTGERETVFGILVSEVSDGLENLDRLTLRDVVFFGDGRRDL